MQTIVCFGGEISKYIILEVNLQACMVLNVNVKRVQTHTHPCQHTQSISEPKSMQVTVQYQPKFLHFG